MTQARRKSVFVSYSSKDASVVHDLNSLLNTLGGIDSWIYEEKLSSNEDWGVEIEKAISNADVLIVVVSKNSVISKAVQSEIRRAIVLKKRIFPVLIDDAEIPENLSDYNFLQLYSDERRALQPLERLRKFLLEKEDTMTTFDFYLYRTKLTIAEQKNLFGQEELSRPEILKRIISEKPSSELRKGRYWHIGNAKMISAYGGYFAVGKTSKSILEKYDEETGNFLEEIDETSPYTHVVFDAELGLFSIARKQRLSTTINGIAIKVKELLQNSETAFQYGISVGLDPISDPKDFIEALQSAYNVKSFTVTFTRSNPFDVDEHFQKPMEKYLDAANGLEGTTTIKGEDLSSDTLVAMTKSTAATGNDAKAYLRPSQKERLIRKSLKSNPAHFALLEEEFTEELALNMARKLYRTVRGNEQS